MQSVASGPQPTVSVHVITYNHAAFIAEALQSAVDQDFDSLEVVVADDGSSDGTIDVVADFARRYPDRVVGILGPHVGINKNYNRVLQRCRGTYVAILNGDDVFLPGKIRRQVEWFEQRAERTLCAHDVEDFDSRTGASLGLHSAVTPLCQGAGAEHFITRGCPFASVSVMVRRATLDQPLLDERLRVVLDWKFAIDAVIRGGEFGVIDGVHARYRVHPQNATHQMKQEMWLDLLTTLALVEASHPELARFTRRGRAHRFYSRGVALLQRGNSAEAAVWFRAAIAEDPFVSPKLPAWYAMSLAPESVMRTLRGLLPRVGRAST